MHLSNVRLSAASLALAIVACSRSDHGTQPRADETPNVQQPPAAVTLSGADQAASARARESATIERGKYLVTIAGCNECHTPKKMGAKGPAPDTSRLLAGQPADEKLGRAPAAAGPWVVAVTGSLTAWSGPWGTTFAANLTPDTATGIGSWTEDQFERAIRTGKHLGGAGSREILPPMPWQELSVMTHDDLAAVFAYLRTIPAVHNEVPPPMPKPGAPPQPAR